MMKNHNKKSLRFCEFRGFLYLWLMMNDDAKIDEYVMNHDASCSDFGVGVHLKIIDENGQIQVKILLLFSMSTLNGFVYKT